MRIVKLSRETKRSILADLLKRSPTNYGDFQDKVRTIIPSTKIR